LGVFSRRPVLREWPRRRLLIFLALGAGYSSRLQLWKVIYRNPSILAGEGALIYVLVGFFIVTSIRHPLRRLPLGEENHPKRCNMATRKAHFLGACDSHFFDGVVANRLGFLVPPGGLVTFRCGFSSQGFRQDSPVAPRVMALRRFVQKLLAKAQRNDEFGRKPRRWGSSAIRCHHCRCI